ncbi:hypothetical protein [Maribacter luteus]|uniref:hypothetical protein n=1 Tax=Maribacter luteus TaxID=2594478 RepID=UPI0024907C85|nr:hypothetical protein [Maribacter luteus]
MSTNKNFVCHSAQCNCNFGDFPDILQVTTQKKHYINDSDGVQKLIASTMELGQPFTANTFG